MCLNPTFLNGGEIVVPCGKCYECKMKHSREWSYRIMLEASLYEENCFMSLTYNEDNLPDGASLKRKDLTDFIKRLRERLRPRRIRVFYVGEYGDLKGRPHYHIICFNYFPSDSYFFQRSKRGNEMYRSPLVESCWTFGFSSIEKLENISQAQYLALYLQKKPKDGRVPPFVGMSNRPGIGALAVSDKFAIDGNIYKDGKYIRCPRYYRDILKKRGFDLSRGAYKIKSPEHGRKYIADILKRNQRFFNKFPALKPNYLSKIKTIWDFIAFLPTKIARFFSKKD